MSDAEPGEAAPQLAQPTSARTAAFQLLVVLGVLGPLLAAGVLLQDDDGPAVSERANVLVPLGIALVGALALGLSWGALRLAGESWSTAGAAREPLARVVGFGLLVALGGYAVAAAVGVLGVMAHLITTDFDLAELIRQRTESFEPLGAIPTSVIVPVAIFVGFYEELLFRGFILSRLRRLLARFGPATADYAAVGLSAALFGAAHAYQGAIGVFQTAALALVFGGVTLWRGNVWSCVVAHALIDTVSLFLLKKFVL